MKLIAFILALFISVLAVMPCTDNITCDKDIHQSIEKSAAHDHEEDPGDLCSPFCSCACCGYFGFVLAFPTFKITTSGVMLTDFTTPEPVDFTSSYFYSFWQPPKISLS